MDQFTSVFDIEKKQRDANATPEEITETRNREAAPLWEEILRSAQYIKANYVLSQKLREAVVYTENQYKQLTYYINDWRLTPDNNLAEREGIKPFVMSRKNFFSQIPNMVRRSAVFTSRC